MKTILTTFLATFLLLVCTAAAGANPMRAQDSEGTVVLVYDAPCKNEAVFAQLEKVNEMLAAAGVPPLTPDLLGRAEVVYRGEGFGACWAQGGEIVLVIDDAGLPESVFIVPAREFKPVLEV